MTVDINKPIEVVWGGDVKPADVTKFNGLVLASFTYGGERKSFSLQVADGALLDEKGRKSGWDARNVKPPTTPYTAAEWPSGPVWIRKKTWVGKSRDLVLAIVDIDGGYVIHNPISPMRVSFAALAAGYEMSSNGSHWMDCNAPPF